MADPVIDASPLILLSRAGYLDLLRVAGGHILVPQAVAAEIRAYGDDDPTFVAISQTDWLEVVPTPDVPPAQLWSGCAPRASTCPTAS